MAFPSSGAVISLEDGLNQARRQAAVVKSLADKYATTMASTTVSSSEILRLLDVFVGSKTVFQSIAALPGIVAYAQNQLGADITNDFSAMEGALTNCINWIVGNFPQSNGFLLARSFLADNTVGDRNFTPAQTSGLVTLLQTLSSTIQ